MSSLIYTNQKSKLTKKQRTKRDALLQHQRAIQAEFKDMHRSKRYSLTAVIPADRNTAHIPSVDTGGCSTTKRESIPYTGTAIIGLSVMHKSNIVPVFSRQDAEDISKMRR